MNELETVGLIAFVVISGVVLFSVIYSCLEPRRMRRK
jgi:hypothetical protein